jgi:hypothetical protein
MSGSCGLRTLTRFPVRIRVRERMWPKDVLIMDPGESGVLAEGLPACLAVCERPAEKCDEDASAVDPVQTSASRFLFFTSCPVFSLVLLSPPLSLSVRCPVAMASFYYCLPELPGIKPKSYHTNNKTEVRGFSPQANYTDRATAACRPS